MSFWNLLQPSVFVVLVLIRKLSHLLSLRRSSLMFVFDYSNLNHVGYTDPSEWNEYFSSAAVLKRIFLMPNLQFFLSPVHYSPHPLWPHGSSLVDNFWGLFPGVCEGTCVTKWLWIHFVTCSSEEQVIGCLPYLSVCHGAKFVIFMMSSRITEADNIVVVKLLTTYNVVVEDSRYVLQGKWTLVWCKRIVY